MLDVMLAADQGFGCNDFFKREVDIWKTTPQQLMHTLRCLFLSGVLRSRVTLGSKLADHRGHEKGQDHGSVMVVNQTVECAGVW